MKTTRELKLKSLSKEDKRELDDLLRVFSSMTRFAFNRLLEGENTGDLNKTLPGKFKMNKRYAEDAVLQAQSIITSQKELLPTRIEDTEAKLNKLEKKIHLYQTGQRKPKKVDLETCLNGLSMRKEKLERKLFELNSYKEKDTIPPVIFGGKKNFIARRKGLISKQEWKDLRTNHLYARGDKAKKGNLNIRLLHHDNRFFLEIANPLLAPEGKTKAPRMKVEVTVPNKYIEEIVNIAIPNDPQKGPFQSYSMEIVRKNGEYFVHFTYDEEEYGKAVYEIPEYHDIIAGIDLNIDRIAVTLLTKQGNFIESRIFYCHELEYTSSNKRDNIVGETVKKLFNWLIEKKVGAIVYEDITLKQQHESNKRFNRQTHAFTKKRLTNAIVRNALRMGIHFKKVNPAYTSVIGRFKYSKKYGISVHEAASFVIGRRGLGFDEKLPKEVIHVLRTVVKPHLISKLGSMEETVKQSKQGKKQRQYLGMLLKNINTFKEHHLWKIWNVVHKTLRFDQYKFKLKEV